jgi:hypothetical protein
MINYKTAPLSIILLLAFTIGNTYATGDILILGDVAFGHKLHVSHTSGNCEACHHKPAVNGAYQNCGACHDGNSNNGGGIGHKKAIHKQCNDCHTLLLRHRGAHKCKFCHGSAR